MVTISVTNQRQFLNRLRNLKVDKHHNLDISTLNLIDELIVGLEEAQPVSEYPATLNNLKSIIIMAKIIEKLPKFAELIEKLIGN